MKTALLILASAIGLSAQSPNLTGWHQLLANGGRVAWSPKNVIAYDHSVDGYFSLYTINPDGSGNTCLTCAGAPGVGVLQQVTVVPGTDEALPNSGTCTMTGGGGTGGTCTFTASGGNLQTVTITNGGTGYTSNPTFNPDSGSLGTSKVTFAVLPLLNAGNPIFTPDGNFIIFMVQNGPSLGNFVLDFPGFPGEGANNDIWATDMMGHFWQLTAVGGTNGSNSGVICPTISFDGTRITWGQRIYPGIEIPYTPGSWELAVADFSEKDGIPSIGTASYYTLGTVPGATEPHGFSRDNGTVFFMGNLDPGMNAYARNIYSFNLATKILTNLTNTLIDWNEYPTSIPLVNRLIYMKWPRVAGDVDCLSDLWSMNYDGTDKKQITFFNTPSDVNYRPEGVCMDTHQWNANFTQLVVFSDSFARYDNKGLPGPIWILDFAPPGGAVTTVSAADYIAPLAPNSIVSLFAANIATQVSVATNPPPAPLPTNLGGVSATITDVSGNATPISLIAVTPNQINAVLPAGLQTGPAVVTLTTSSGAQITGGATLISTAPSLFSANETGKGTAAAQVVIGHADGSQTFIPAIATCSTSSCTPIPIDLGSSTDHAYLVLFGTGIRGAGGATAVTAKVGNIPCPVSFAGAQGTYFGLDQVDIELPHSLAGSGTVNVVITAAGETANTVTLDVQ